MTQIYHELTVAAQRMRGLEVVPGVPLSPPRFRAAWSAKEILDLQRLVGRVPESFSMLLEQLGAIDAVEIGGGLTMLSLTEIEDHLGQEFSPRIRSLSLDERGEVAVVPFAINSSGDYLLAAEDDSGVWVYNAHMPDVAQPRLIADSFGDFLIRLRSEWESVASRTDQPPYLTS
jgi:hypothetical protein